MAFKTSLSRGPGRDHGVDLHLTGHGLRHSLISALYGSNTGDGLVRKIAGHQDPQMSDHYHQLIATGACFIPTSKPA